MKLRPLWLILAFAARAGALAAPIAALGACGDDTPYVPQDGGGGPQPGSYTAFVIDLVTNHSGDAAPASYAAFKDLPDPDADGNNLDAYRSLFP